jgi:hypothetical protein
MLGGDGERQADAVYIEYTEEARMKIKVTKVERIEATAIHRDPNAPDGAA